MKATQDRNLLGDLYNADRFNHLERKSPELDIDDSASNSRLWKV